MNRRIRRDAAGRVVLISVLAVGLIGLVGCDSSRQAVGFIDRGVPRGSFGLVSFSSCDDALRGLRGAAKTIVGPYGLWPNVYATAEGGAKRDVPGVPAPQAAGDAAAGPNSGTLGSAPNYSGTNVHEVGVDEPDLVKTDGKRIVVVSGGTLRVVDPAGRRVTGFLDLITPTDAPGGGYAPADLLLFGDHALVLMRQEYYAYRGGGMVDDVAVPPVARDPAPGAPPAGALPAPAPTPTKPSDVPLIGPRLILVDLSGQPRVLSTLHTDGALIDARQVGSTVRAVIKSNPRLVFPYVEKATDAARIAANKAIIDKAKAQDWLPRIEVRTGGQTSQTFTNCEAISRPSSYTSTNMLTIVSVDLAASELGDGAPITVVADGDTVYSDGRSLFVASDQRWWAQPQPDGRAGVAITPQTEIYKFDTPAATLQPTFAAGGAVPGYLINQYAMSAWEDNLRVATTMGEPWAAPGQAPSQSGVHVLAQRGNSLTKIGSVVGLGKGERIYAVRFVGPVGYIVTFRQTDPLYTVDLSDPQRPVVRGELKIAGYSAYLHPAGADRLIGIGQDANAQGRVRGTQVSLFNVADLSQPTRIATYTVSGANSEAEFDPHAFLYWPRDGLLVVPLQVYNAVPVPGPGVPGGPVKSGGGSGGASSGSGVATPTTPAKLPTIGALVLRVNDNSISELGFISHPTLWNNPGYPDQIRRSLIIDDTLWTVSDGGIMATDAHSIAPAAWIPFT